MGPLDRVGGTRRLESCKPHGVVKNNVVLKAALLRLHDGSATGHGENAISYFESGGGSRTNDLDGAGSPESMGK